VLSLTSPLLPLTLKFEPLAAQAQTIQDRATEAKHLLQKGSQQYRQAQFKEALAQFQQALEIYQQIGDKAGKAEALNHMGEVYNQLSQDNEALKVLQQALAIRQQLNDRSNEGTVLVNLAAIYLNAGQYPTALKFFQQALDLYREIDDHTGEASTRTGIGLIYYSLGQYFKALEIHQQALALYRELGARGEEGGTLLNMGLVYTSLGQYSKALKVYQQALTIAREMDNRPFERMSLLNMGLVYTSLRQYSKALEVYQQALAIGVPAGEARIIRGIGFVYYNLGQYPKALELYQQALGIEREEGDSVGEWFTLTNIGDLLKEQNSPELAIVFYKQSINLIKAIRKELQVLPKEQQQSYTETVADTYRRLADLLLKQDRILEAQRVLDLLKVQELDDYLSNVRGNNNTAQGLPNLSSEQQTWTSYQAILNKAMEIGKELTQLRQIKPENRTAEQEQRIAQLMNVQQKIVEDFNNFIESPEVLALVQQLNPKARKADLVNNLDQLIGLQDNLKNLQQKAVLLYPLILDDRIELILTTPDSPPIRRTVQVPKKQLNETIVAFRSALQDPKSNAKASAQQLYSWLIKPLEADLKAANAQTIIYAPDAQLRYIPLAALHDGQQWLVQCYRINNITAASLTDLNTKPQPQMQVLAGAFATGRYSFKVGGEFFDFAGLPSAGVEVENLAKTVPSTTKFIDKAFTPEVTVPKMDDYTIVHLATHAAFVVGTPDDSFILFGNGERITLRDIQTWSLKNVDLVVLSACETGLGGKLGNGEEILGLGYQMQRAGARAAIASLWSVNDGGTQALMNAFYGHLKTGNTTKAEALRQAQITLITGNSTALGKDRGSVEPEPRNSTPVPPQVANRLSHPYYWAPFILIGNGL
jgi:CHAT domain-containing protein/Tfp pilus assembly protein PilF